MPSQSDSNVLTADVLTLLWEAQLSNAAAIEELALWIKSQGGTGAHAKAIDALGTLDANASAISAGIMALRG